MNLQMNLMSRRALLQRGGLGLGSFAPKCSKETTQRATTNPPLDCEEASFSCQSEECHLPSWLEQSQAISISLTSNLSFKESGGGLPSELFESGKFAFVRSLPKLLSTPDTNEYRFTSGKSATHFKSLPHLQTVADEITSIKSMHTEEFNHGPAQMFMLSGFGRLDARVLVRG